MPLAKLNDGSVMPVDIDFSPMVFANSSLPASVKRADAALEIINTKKALAQCVGAIEGVIAAITAHGNSPSLNRVLVLEHLDMLILALADARRSQR
jgi:hypothetical protein